MNRNEVVILMTQAEVETKSHMGVEISETKTGPVARLGRQRRPAAIVTGHAPANPSRPPTGVWRPDPTDVPMVVPAAIMERRPAPGIIGQPIPAAVGVKPAAAITIRPPANVHHGDGRLPAPAIAGDFNPTSIRGK